MKKVLIISPYFPPVNAADMQRVRMSLPYFADCGWTAEILMIDENHATLDLDALLVEGVPPDIKIHKVNAFSIKLTSVFGLGSIALRSLWYYLKKGNELLKTQKFDLVYFSTTQFPVCILGALWKKKYGVPYVIDMQDPWFSDYYQDKPKEQRPSKYWFSYHLNKFMEPIAMHSVNGLISVSQDYITGLKSRYPEIKDVPASTITFGAFEPDLLVAAANKTKFIDILDPAFKNIVYIGRGGNDMHAAIRPLFQAVKNGVIQGTANYRLLKFYFIGTSYAAAGMGVPTVMPLADEYGLSGQVIEITDRIGYFHALTTLQQADGLFIPGSDDPKYTASKIFPYLLTQKRILAIFNKKSSAINIMKEYGVADIFDFEQVSETQINNYLSAILNDVAPSPIYNREAIKKYSAQQMTVKQCQLFNLIVCEEN